MPYLKPKTTAQKQNPKREPKTLQTAQNNAAGQAAEPGGAVQSIPVPYLERCSPARAGRGGMSRAGEPRSRSSAGHAMSEAFPQLSPGCGSRDTPFLLLSTPCNAWIAWIAASFPAGGTGKGGRSGERSGAEAAPAGRCFASLPCHILNSKMTFPRLPRNAKGPWQSSVCRKVDSRALSVPNSRMCPPQESQPGLGAHPGTAPHPPNHRERAQQEPSELH